jgi:carboxyl-terminal processing protease
VILLRDVIQVDSVHGDWLNPDGSWDFFLKDHPHIGYIRLSQFGDRTVNEFRSAVQKVNGSIDCLIIDLRLNSGGLLDAAVSVCSMFLPKGTMVVEIRSRNEGNNKINTNESPILPGDLPIVVLINRHSASASEIVAACLQDHGRATIIGERSYGKGTVQNVIPLERGRSAIKLTTASYWRPSGVNIDKNHASRNKLKKWGVLPDPGFEFEFTEEDIFQEARNRNIRDLEGIQNGRPKPVEDPPAGNEEPSPPFVDRSLQKAIEFLLSKIGKPIAT